MKARQPGMACWRTRAVPIAITLALFAISADHYRAGRGSGQRPGGAGGDVDTIVGRVINTQAAAVDEAEVVVLIEGERRSMMVAGEEVEAAETDPAGFYITDLDLTMAQVEAGALAIEISKPGYRISRQGFARQEVARAADHYYIRVPDVVLSRIFNPAFFLATGIFVVVFGLISLNLLHETIAAFLGAAAMLGVSYFVGSFRPRLLDHQFSPRHPLYRL